MSTGSWGRWLFMLAIGWTSANAVVSCGGSGGNNGTGNPMDASPGLDDRSVTVNPDGPSFGGHDSSTCTRKTTCVSGVDCGHTVPDGCGGLLDCSMQTCPTGQCCGCDPSLPDKCGNSAPSDAGPGDAGVCYPKNYCQLKGYNCGYVGDGCGNALDCNPNDGAAPCAPPQFCGGGGFNVCGGNNGLAPDGGVPCTPSQSCTSLNYTCGYGNDGCGNPLNCNPPGGACPSPQFCGGGGFNKCGGNSGLTADGGSICKPLSCQQLGFTCGPAGDGCGGMLNCYPNNGTSCPSGMTCGGGGKPGQCGNGNCLPTQICSQVPQCDGGAVTTITGRVVAGTLPIYLPPGGSPDPVPNVLVYVPNAPLQPFKPGAQCSQCGADVSGSPIASTHTAFDGTFTLTNVPASMAPPGRATIPVVIQLGRWRREVQFAIPPCMTTNVGDIRMPRNQSEGDIPLTAFSTGAVDSLECVLLKMGVDATEFTTNTGGGRVHLYSCKADHDFNNNNGSGVTAGAGSQCEAALLDMGGTFMNYDQILLPCWGYPAGKTNAELGNLVTYSDKGGRFFATHFSYSWLFTNNPFNMTATWDVAKDGQRVASMTGDVRLSPPAPAPNNPQGTIFSQWLGLVGALSNTNPPQLTINAPRHDVDSIPAQSTSVDWIDGTDPIDQTPMVLNYTFDTPVGAASQCGHAIYSDFHVNDTHTDPTVTFPSECDMMPLTAQEKVLEYLIWNLASCVGPPPPPKCTPITCASQNISCGPASDGCGNLIQSCGMCTPPQTCGGGGVPGQCGAPDGGSCSPLTCQMQNINCGPAGDGCGNPLMCGPCTPPQTCGGGGVPGQCGYPDGGKCAAKTCSDQNITCGPAGDGCGNELMCGTCMVAGQTCGGGGTPGQCGAPDGGSCKPKTCGDQGIQCGPAGDGCGNLLQCGNCTPPMFCGGGGVMGKCGGTQ